MTIQVLHQTPGGKLNDRRRHLTARSAASIAIAFVAFALSASPLLAESHPFLEPLGGSANPDTFSNPNGIAVDESSGDVYVADIGTDTVSKFDRRRRPGRNLGH